MDYIIAIDQGTTGTTCLAVDDAGTVLGRGYSPVISSYPADGFVEQDPEDIWKSVLIATGRACNALTGTPVGIGITNQRETTILWDSSTGQAEGPAIVWQDRRTTPICENLINSGHGALVQERSGLVIDPYFSGTKIAWMLRNDIDLYNKGIRGKLLFGTVDSWLVWKLSGGKSHLIDATNASRTMLAKIDRPEWDSDLLGLLDIPSAMLPDIVPSSGKLAATTNVGGIPSGLPISGIAGDQHAALFGQACFTPGMVKATYGTGCFLLQNTGANIVKSQSSLLTTVAWQIGTTRTYALEGSVFMGGSVVQWLRDEMGLLTTSEESEDIARSVSDTAGVVFVPAFVGLGAPHWNPRARGLIIGLTHKATKAHIIRSGLESIAHQVTDVIEAMSSEHGGPPTEIRVDGGAAANNLLMQMQSDLVGCNVIRPSQIETTAMGAALLAGLELGFWDNTDEITDMWKEDHIFKPVNQNSVQARRQLWKRALTKCLDWA